MRVPLGNDVYVNVAHISLLDGVQKVSNQPEARELKLLLIGGNEYKVIGTEKEMKALHGRLLGALDQLGP